MPRQIELEYFNGEKQCSSISGGNMQVVNYFAKDKREIKSIRLTDTNESYNMVLLKFISSVL